MSFNLVWFTWLFNLHLWVTALHFVLESAMLIHSYMSLTRYWYMSSLLVCKYINSCRCMQCILPFLSPWSWSTSNFSPASTFTHRKFSVKNPNHYDSPQDPQWNASIVILERLNDMLIEASFIAWIWFNNRANLWSPCRIKMIFCLT